MPGIAKADLTWNSVQVFDTSEVRRVNEFNQLPELSDKKMEATNAPPEPPLKHAKMIILLMKIRLFSL